MALQTPSFRLAIFKGKRPDLALLPGDVLYLPFSFARNFATTGATSIAASATARQFTLFHKSDPA